MTPAPLTITANNQSNVYGAALPLLTASYSGFVNGDSSASLTAPSTLSTTATAGSHVAGGPYPITVSGAVDSDYTIGYAAGSLNVTPAPLTITANNQSNMYGAALPLLTASYSGFVNGDSSASLTAPSTLSTTATAGSHVAGGPYPITASGAADPDYTIGYAAGSLNVTPAPLTITANNQSNMYGAALPLLTASYSGFVNGDSSASLTAPSTLSTTATAGSHVAGGPYPITVSGAVDSDYTIGYAAGSLNVTPAPLTITANNQSNVYGAALPLLTASYSGFVNSDSSASLTAPSTLSTTATAGSHVAGGPYPITVSGAVDSDYTIGYAAGSLNVTPAPLTITANNQSNVYGAALPLLTASYSGFVNGDSSASLNAPPTLSTTATAGSHVAGGPYPITASGAADPDYTIGYAAGSLNVTPAPLTITANNQSNMYGAALPLLTASYSGFVNGDSSASLNAPPTLSTTATAGSHVAGGPYPITASGAADPDYTIGYAAGSLNVTPAPLTITANNQSNVYGAALPLLTASYSGFVNSDSSASLTAPSTLSTTATAGSHVAGGPYPITASGAVDSDYTIGYAAGSLNVTPAPLTITANNQSNMYGAALPLLTASYSGFVNSDSSASLATPSTLSTTATAGSHVAGGPYPITVSGAVDSDYTIGYAAGSLNVTPAPLTITANNQSNVYGAALPLLTASYSGFVNGDSSASLTAPSTLSTTATAGSHVAGGPYPITVSGAVDSDYTIGYAAGSLNVTPAPLTITANNQSNMYGAALPLLTASYSGFVNGDSSASLTAPPTVSTTVTATSVVLGNPYLITVSGATNSDYAISFIVGGLTVAQATATVIVSDASGIYTGSYFAATATVAGVVSEVDSNPAPSLEGVMPTPAYYIGTVATGTPLPLAPSSAGTYTVVASFAGSTDYTSGTASTTFTISKATPGVSVTDNGGTYTGAAFAATTASLEGVTPSLTYYSGTSATGTASSGAPTTAGTYTVLASFAGSTDYTNGSASTTFTIGRAAPTVSVSDASGTYNSAAYVATDTVAGVGSQSTASASLEEATPSLTYYSGTSATGTASSSAPTAAGTYTVLASFAGSTDYTSGSVSTTFTIGRAAPTVSVSDASGTYNGAAYAATDTVAGVGSQSTASASLEGATPSLTYYLGTSATGTASSGAPTTAGTYTVLANFVGSTDYISGSASTTFTINPAAPTVSVSDASGTYNSAAYAATDTVAGVGSQSTASASLEGVTPSLTYYSGTSATGTASSAAPTLAGTYTVLASFVGSTDYTSGSASMTFTIGRAAPTVSVSDASGTYNGAAYAATDTVAGVGSQSTASASLEGATPSLTYYSGTSATGTASSGAPTTAGTYTVLASFAGSTDYTSGSASTTFTIGRAAPTVNVFDASGTYNSAAYAATDTVAGVGSQSTSAASLEGASPSLTYYSGTSATGTASSSASDGGRHLYGAGQLRRQYRLHQRLGEHDIHDRPSRSDGKRV